MPQKKGFTLIELLIVLALIAILAGVLVAIIKPAEILRRGRDAQRAADLRNLASAVDAYLNEMALNPTLGWITRGSCNVNNFFSIPISGTSYPSGWPTSTTLTSPTGTNSVSADGNGWVPLRFNQVTILSLNQLPLDPQNGQNVNNVVRAYSFACDNNLNYEFSTYPENTSTAGTANDGGNQPNLLEVGSKKDIY
jgi:prepilin-type N-terminal cleavage/methylation domain-containing protein